MCAKRTIDAEKRLGDYTSVKQVEVGLRRHLRGDDDRAVFILERPVEARETQYVPINCVGPQSERKQER